MSRKNWAAILRAGIFAAVLILLVVAPSHGQDLDCSFTASNLSFGNVDLSSPGPFDGTANFTYTCTGDSRQMVRICPSIDAGEPGAMTDSAGHKLLFNIYSDESHATVWNSWYGKTKAPQIDVPIGRSGSTGGSAVIYGEIVEGQSAPPGTYKVSIGGGHVLIDYDNATKGSCESIRHGGKRGKVGFTVMATVRSSAGGATANSGNANGGTQGGGDSGSPTAQLKRGMKIEEVTRLLGKGTKKSESVGDGGLKTQIYDYLSGDRQVEVTYVDGLVIRFSISSR